jgi:hypothetical protein
MTRSNKTLSKRMSESNLLAIFCLFGLAAGAAPGATTARNDLLERLEAFQLEYSLTSGQLPILEMIIAGERQRNPVIPEKTWVEIRSELLHNVLARVDVPGSSYDMTFRRAMENLSDEELKQMLTVSEDPAFRKYRSALSAPAMVVPFASFQREIVKVLTDQLPQVLKAHSLPVAK